MILPLMPLVLALATQPADVAALVAFIDARIPREGVLEATYEIAKQGSFGKIVVGYDLGSNAAYRIHNGTVMARDPQGRSWVGNEGDATLVPDTGRHAATSWRGVEIGMTVNLLDWARDHPERIVTVRTGGREGFEFDLSVPSTNGDSTYAISIDERARITRTVEALDEPPDVVVEFEYLDAELPILARRRNFEHVSHVFHERSDPALFAPERLVKLMNEAKTKHVSRRPVVTRDTPIPSSVPKGLRGVTKDTGWTATYRTPLIVTGIVALVIGAWAWWRQRA